jgi:putative ABC transport system ATP-binding protein
LAEPESIQSFTRNSVEAPHSGPPIRLVGVRKNYQTGDRKVEALRGLDLEIHRPGFYAIMGPSGSGKSTLLHILAALDGPDAGTVEVCGQAIHGYDEHHLTEFRRRQIGIVFQQFNLISTLTAIDNVTLPAMLDGMPTDQRNRKGLELLHALGLHARSHHRPDALSGGEQQRVAIARALMFEPKVLFADEPTGNLDSATSLQMWALLKHLASQRQMTVLMVTHEPAAAVHCETVFIIRDGRIEDQFNTEGLNAIDLAARAQLARR